MIEMTKARVLDLTGASMKKVEDAMSGVDFSNPCITRHIREALGISQYDMAELLDCSQGTVSRAERGISEKWRSAELEFLLEVIAVLDGEDKYLVLTTAGVLTGIVPASKAMGKSFIRKHYK